MDPELSGEEAAERRRLTAALQMAEDDVAHVTVKPAGKFLGDDLAHAIQPNPLFPFVPCMHEPLVRQVSSLSHDDRREPLALGLTPGKFPHTLSNVQGISGRRIPSPPPAIPAWRAIQSARRPITSSTMMRSWLAAVVCSLLRQDR